MENKDKVVEFLMKAKVPKEDMNWNADNSWFNEMPGLHCFGHKTVNPALAGSSAEM
jgi:hypothetical protein